MKSLYSFLSRANSASNVKLSVSTATNQSESLLKKFILLTAGILVQLVLVESSHAQCYMAAYGAYPSTAFTPACNGLFANILTDAWAGEYSNVNLVAGNTYTFRSSVTTDYITVDNDGAIPLVGVIGVSGSAGINWTCTATGTYRFYTHTSSACGAAQVLRTRSIKCASSVAPTNDACAAATSLPCGTSLLAGTTVNSVSETVPAGAGSNFGVWYTFVGDGQNTTITSTTSFDHRLTVFTETCGMNTILTSQDASVGTETVTFTTTNGLQYRVYVSHFSAGSTTTGTFAMSRTCTPLAYNPCTSIPTISGCGISATASMSGTGAGWSVTSCGFATPGQERLFSFTAPSTGTYSLNVSAISGGYVDFFWKAASGGCNATGWNCIDDISVTGTFSAITPMSFTAGTTYYILLDPEAAAAASATFSLVCPIPPPSNDLCSGSTSVTCGATVTVNTGNANTDAIGSTTCGTTITTPGVWYQIAGNGQVMTISTVGLTTSDTKLIVYSGSCAGLTCVGGSDDFSGAQAQITWSSVSGTTYYVLAALYTGTGSFPMSLSCVAPCTGTPNPGATTATSSQVFAGGSTTLGITTAQSGAGISYQWQSGPSASGPWNSIGGATSSTYLASPTTSTYYQCVVTCSNGGASGTSTPILISFNPYCNPDYTGYTATPQNGTEGTVDGDMITNITITSGATTLLNNTSTSALSTPQYTFYSSLPTITMFPSNTYNVNVTAGTYTDQNFAVWIDYNDDNDFYDANELIGFSTAATTIANQTISFPINLACEPPLGTHRMRVRDVYFTAGNTINPCTTYGWGETEDYLITMAAAPACPSPGLVSTITPTSNSVALTWATNCSSATSYDFEYGPAGFTLGSGILVSNQTVTISAPNASYTVTGLQAGTNYDIYYRANCGSSTSAWSLTSNFSTPNSVSAASSTPTLCQGTVMTSITHNTQGATGIGTATGLPSGVTAAWSSNIITISGIPTVSGVFGYSIPLTGGFGSLNATGTITVLEAPIAPTATSPQQFCETSNSTIASLQYSSIAGSSYLWYTASTGGTSLSTSQGLTLGTTTYYLEVVGSNGCISLTRTPVVVTEDPLLTATVSITGTTACPGGVLLFTSTPVNGGTNPTFQWYNGGIAISGANQSTYSATGLAPGDVINVKMVPSGSCVTVCQ